MLEKKLKKIKLNQNISEIFNKLYLINFILFSLINNQTIPKIPPKVIVISGMAGPVTSDNGIRKYNNRKKFFK